MTPLPTWRLRAACIGVDPDLFFPDPGDSILAQRAKAVCDGCPVSDECLAFALARHEMFGVWGGKTRRERLAISSARWSSD
ncbi:WhiB family transcriptional regulator [Mycolicibacterium pulveris]|uniref:WhiB family transcriptional regulator n=1 Tax=Mycolicibacterium pulveris TaxID=36813 RepID=UPI003CF9D3E6